MNPRTIRKLITLVLIVILSAIFGATTDSFLSARNVMEIFRVAAYTGLIAAGTSFVLIGGGIDLSTGGIICFAGVICTRMACMGIPVAIVVLSAIIVSAICGLLNGVLITRLHLNDFITTLATGYVFSGFALLCILKDDRGNVVSQQITNKGFLLLGKNINGLYYIVIAWALVTLLAWLIQTRTTYGLHITAMGSNAKSSEMSGLNVTKLKITTYVIDGLVCGLAAAFTVSYQQTTYLNLGSGMGFNAVAACVVGGVVLGGGKGNAVGAFLGSLFMTLVTNGMYKYGLSTSWQYVFQGAVIMIAILFDAGLGMLTAKRLLSLANANENHAALGTKGKEGEQNGG